MQVELATERLELRPLPPAVAGELLRARERAVRELGGEIPLEWPDPDLVELLARHADMTSSEAVWSIWPIIDREARTVVSNYRWRGYATEAARALVAWAQRQPGGKFIAAASRDEHVASIRTLRRLGFRQARRRGGELRWRIDPAAVQ